MQIFEALSFSNLAAPASGVPLGNVVVDWTNYVTRNLIGCFLPGVSLSQDITGGVGGVPYLTSFDTAFAVSDNPDGPSTTLITNTNTGMSALTPAGTPYRYTAEFSIRVRLFIPVNAGGIFEIGGLVFDITVNTTPFNVASLVSNAAGTFINVSWNTGGTNTTLATPVWTSNVMLDWVATFKVGGNVTWYSNGVQGAQTTFGASAPNFGANTGLLINHGYPSTPRQGALANLFMFWNRELQADEVMAMYLNPYGFLIPQDGDIQSLFVPPLTLMPQICL